MIRMVFELVREYAPSVGLGALFYTAISSSVVAAATLTLQLVRQHYQRKQDDIQS